MTTQVLIPLLTSQFFANNGAFLVGGELWSYQAGTNIPAATYTDSTGVTPNTNPVIANSRGEMSVWVPPNVAYKFVLQDSSGNTIWTRDQVLNAQLITYYGVDTGAANAYILTAATPYTTYQNGELVFFVPAQTNTGPSTVNINGLGVIPIVTITGAAIGAGQLQAGIIAQLIYFNGNFQLLSIGSFTGSTVGTFGQEVSLASAATTDLGIAPAHTVLLTGSTTITSFGTTASIAAPYYLLRFAGALTLTYNASSMILPGGASITTSSGDSAIAQYLGTGLWRVAFYQYSQSAASNAKIKPSDTAIVSSATLTADPDLQTNTLGVGRYSYELLLIFDSVAAGAGFQWTNDGTLVDSRGVMPGLVSGFVNAAAVGPANSSFYATTISYATVSTAANSNQVLYKGSILVGTAGTLGIKWAQAASTASATTLRAGSYLVTTLLNTGASANIVQRVYQTPGPGTETFPTGYNTLTIECWGATGGGGTSFGSGVTLTGGGGGAAGGYTRTVLTVTGLGGLTLNYLVGLGGAVDFAGSVSTVTSGTQAITTMTSNGGNPGTNASSITAPGSGGTGGTASGGTAANTAGNNGGAGQTQSGTPPGGGGSAGLGVAGIYFGGNSGGRGGGSIVAQAGANGIVLFNYS
jgi:hypothetical protein